MRTLACCLLMAVTGLAVAANSRVQKAASNDEMLITAGVEPDQAEIRMPCSAAVIDSSDEPEVFDCVYVQTGHALNLFSLEDGYLMSEMQMTVGTMDGVALQHMGRYSQVQVFSGNRVAAFYVYDNSWIDRQKTEAAYQWLLDHGVPLRNPQKWIGK